MNALTTTSQSSILPPLPERVDHVLTKMHNALDRRPAGLCELPAHAAPSDEQRAYLERRAAAQDRALSSAGLETARIEIAIIFDVMKIRSADEMTLTARIEVYANDLASLPGFALAQACRDYRTSVVGDGEWAPTPGQLRKRAVAIAEPQVSERARIRQVLSATIAPARRVDESKRAAALALAKHVADEMRLQPDPMRPKEQRLPTRNEAEEWLEREKANPHCPAPSAILRQKLGLPDPKQDSEAA